MPPPGQQTYHLLLATSAPHLSISSLRWNRRAGASRECSHFHHRRVQAESARDPDSAFRNVSTVPQRASSLSIGRLQESEVILLGRKFIPGLLLLHGRQLISSIRRAGNNQTVVRCKDSGSQGSLPQCFGISIDKTRGQEASKKSRP
ncbi:hypothetical protein O6H91_Y177000 [Diphasiastrum complanatum]|nr:hypothetical protein O6H91_Y177000 [Diphasiastrum complanatum]